MADPFVPQPMSQGQAARSAFMGRLRKEGPGVPGLPQGVDPLWRPHGSGWYPKNPVQQKLYMQMLDEEEQNADGPTSRPIMDPRDSPRTPSPDLPLEKPFIDPVDLVGGAVGSKIGAKLGNLGMDALTGFPGGYGWAKPAARVAQAETATFARPAAQYAETAGLSNPTNIPITAGGTVSMRPPGPVTGTMQAPPVPARTPVPGNTNGVGTQVMNAGDQAELQALGAGDVGTRAIRRVFMDKTKPDWNPGAPLR